MKIAIDLNDVIRDFSDNFLKLYVNNYNHEFSLDDFEFWTNDMKQLFPFKSDNAYNKFVYEDYSFDIFAKCDVCSRNLSVSLSKWIDSLADYDLDEKIEMMVVSPFEFGSSVNYSYFFISKLGCQIREVYFPMDSATIWDKCDVLITANPTLLAFKPENKISVKIDRDYNTESEADYKFKSLASFLSNENNTEELINRFKNEEHSE